MGGLTMKEIPISEKYMLSIEEAAAYFRIGENKLISFAHEHMDADWLFLNGNRIQIKRTMFEKLLDGINTL